MARQRRDADRRSRQCARFARLIRIARLVTGNGRWRPEDLAREVECSERTIYRDIEILSAAGIPVLFDKTIRAYRVTEGFRFSRLDPQQVETCDSANPAVHDLLVNARRVLKDAEAFLETLRTLCNRLEATGRAGS
jgi:predicted DNA-binding transcriptional regulator YafY